MMECFCCKNQILDLYFCPICRKILCSIQCQIMHYKEYHIEIIFTSKIYRSKNDLLLKRTTFPGYFIHTSPYILSKEELTEFLIIKNKDGSPFIIGTGSFSKVYLVKHKICNKQYALKKINKKLYYNKYKSLETIKQKIEIQSKIYHKNICRLVGVYENLRNYYLFLEYMDNGNLQKAIDGKKIKNEKQVYDYLIQIIDAINFLHENNIIYLDIKPKNILINSYNEIKICGFSCFYPNKPNYTYDTNIYAAPEILKGSSYDNSVDIWSLGYLLYKMTHNCKIFDNCIILKRVLKQIKENKFDFGKNMNIKSNEIKELIQQMIVVEPQKRIKINDIYESSFFNKFKDNNKKIGNYFINKSTIQKKLIGDDNTKNDFINNFSEINKLKNFSIKKDNTHINKSNEKKYNNGSKKMTGNKNKKLSNNKYFSLIKRITKKLRFEKSYLYRKNNSTLDLEKENIKLLRNNLNFDCFNKYNSISIYKKNKKNLKLYKLTENKIHNAKKNRSINLKKRIEINNNSSLSRNNRSIFWFYKPENKVKTDNIKNSETKRYSIEISIIHNNTTDNRIMNFKKYNTSSILNKNKYYSRRKITSDLKLNKSKNPAKLINFNLSHTQSNILKKKQKAVKIIDKNHSFKVNNKLQKIVIGGV